MSTRKDKASWTPLSWMIFFLKQHKIIKTRVLSQYNPVPGREFWSCLYKTFLICIKQRTSLGIFSGLISSRRFIKKKCR